MKMMKEILNWLVCLVVAVLVIGTLFIVGVTIIVKGHDYIPLVLLGLSVASLTVALRGWCAR